MNALKANLSTKKDSTGSAIVEPGSAHHFPTHCRVARSHTTLGAEQ
jgi:hypothetical protein